MIKFSDLSTPLKVAVVYAWISCGFAIFFFIQGVIYGY